MLGTNSYLFRHQGAIFNEFINNKGSWPKRISGAGLPQFHHKN